MTVVEINDRFFDNWQWGKGPYFEWCAEHCKGDYNVTKYRRNKVTGIFENPEDASAFIVRWEWNS